MGRVPSPSVIKGPNLNYSMVVEPVGLLFQGGVRPLLNRLHCILKLSDDCPPFSKFDLAVNSQLNLTIFPECPESHLGNPHEMKGSRRIAAESDALPSLF